MCQIGTQVGFSSRGALVRLTGYMGLGQVKPLSYLS
jgi:hypothetical protein